jgi:ParB-like nuclease domain
MNRTRGIASKRGSSEASGGADRPSKTGQFGLLATDELTPHPRNPRKHSRLQIHAIAKSIKFFGFNAPILIDRNRRILAGHGRWEAAKLSDVTHVPVVFLDHLTDLQADAYMLADNKLTDIAARRIPAMYQWPEMAEEGGFVAYGPRLSDLPELPARLAVKLF